MEQKPERQDLGARLVDGLPGRIGGRVKGNVPAAQEPAKGLPTGCRVVFHEPAGEVEDLVEELFLAREPHRPGRLPLAPFDRGLQLVRLGLGVSKPLAQACGAVAVGDRVDQLLDLGFEPLEWKRSAETAAFRSRDTWGERAETVDEASKLGAIEAPRLFMIASTDWAPACDISETETEYRVQAELPSMKKDDVHVMLQNGVLTIQGERREEKEEKGVKFHRRELSYGSFVRRFSMPDDADQAKVDATFKDGMLSVVIGKTKAKQSTAKEIAIQ